MQEILEIRCKDEELEKALLTDATDGKIVLDTISDATVRLKRIRNFRSAEFNQIIELIVSSTASIGASIIARWLYDRLLGKRVRLLIGGHPVDLSEAAISRALIDAVKQPTSGKD